MPNDPFEVILDPAKKREMQLFTGAVLMGANMATVILHALVLKGVFTKEVAAALIDDALTQGEPLSLPENYRDVPAMIAKALKQGFQ